MALIDEWIEAALRQNAGRQPPANGGLEPGPNSAPELGLEPTINQDQLIEALREIIPPDMLMRLNQGARFCFPYHTLGAVYSICLEKQRGRLVMRISPQPNTPGNPLEGLGHGSRKYRVLRKKNR